MDREGRLWIALTSPFTYVYDGSGDKVRTVQFRGAGLLTPNSLFFTKDGRMLVTPGCYEFKVPEHPVATSLTARARMTIRARVPWAFHGGAACNTRGASLSL